MAALGAETASGDFEVFEMLHAGLPPQPPRPASAKGEWVALMSGLQLGGTVEAELKAAMLAEWLTGELGSEDDGAEAVKVTRLILAGNSLALPSLDEADEKKPVSSLRGKTQLLCCNLTVHPAHLRRNGMGTTSRCSRPSQPLRSTASSISSCPQSRWTSCPASTTRAHPRCLSSLSIRRCCQRQARTKATAPAQILTGVTLEAQGKSALRHPSRNSVR